MFKRNKHKSANMYDDWFDNVDEESKQETAIKYLRSLTDASLKNLYDAVEKYREGDRILKKVKEPKPEAPKPAEGEVNEELLDGAIR